MTLSIIDTLHIGLEVVEQLVLALGHGARDDKRGTGIVNQHAIDLIDDGIVVRTLHHVLGAHRHIVTQVVKTELTVGTEGDVAVVGGTAFGRVGLGLVDTGDGHAVEHVQRTHPLAIALGQVVVDGYNMHTVAGQAIEEDGQGGHQGFTFTSRHLGNLTLMQDDTTDELYVIVYHIPLHVVTTGNPVIGVYGLVAVDGDKVLTLGSQVAVELSGGYGDGFVLGKASCCRFHDGKHGGEHLVELVLEDVENLLLDIIDLLPQRFALLVVEGFDFGFDALNLIALVLYRVVEILADIGSALSQAVDV